MLLMTPGSNPKEVIARRALMLGYIHFAGPKWQKNPACSFPAWLTSVYPRVSLCCRGRRSWDQTCTVLFLLLCSVLPASLGAGWRREGAGPRSAPGFGEKQAMGFQQVWDSQAPSWLVLTLGLELCWWILSPCGLLCFVDAEMCGCIWGRWDLGWQWIPNTWDSASRKHNVVCFRVEGKRGWRCCRLLK